jgi:hypothetical protein
MDAFYLSNKYVRPTSYDVWVKIRDRLEWICDNWQLPDAGIWEIRNRQKHFVYSKVMNWVALDRGLRLADKRALPADRAKWLRERDRIYEEVMTKAGTRNDTRVLRQRRPGRVAPYYAAGLLYGSDRSADAQHHRRHPQESAGWRSRQRQPCITLSAATPHGWTARRGGTFTMCSFWLVEALTRSGLAFPEKLDQVMGDN